MYSMAMMQQRVVGSGTTATRHGRWIPLALLLVAGCQKPETAPEGLVVGEPQVITRQQCAAPTDCADFSQTSIILTGNDTALVRRIRERLEQSTLALLGDTSHHDFGPAIDTIASTFIADYVRLRKEFPETAGKQWIKQTSAVLLNSAQVLTVRLDLDSYTGGAHPNTNSALLSFDLTKGGALLTAADLLSDTVAVIPLLEAAYKAAKGLSPSDNIQAILMKDVTHLPLPANLGVVPEGVLFVYRDYEVAPHSTGPQDLLINWEQLGSLAERRRWIPDN